MKHILLKLPLAAVLAMASSVAVAAHPPHDFGEITDYGVYTEPPGSWSQPSQGFPMDLSFSIATDSDLRIDARSSGTHTKYIQHFIRDAAFSVHDASHVLVGTGVNDPSYSDNSCTGNFAINGGCNRDVGLTFNGRLKAGTYTVTFSAVLMDVVSPEIRIGVANLTDGLNPLYLVAVTPGGVVPEPATVLSMGLGLAGLGALRFGRRHLVENAQPDQTSPR